MELDHLAVGAATLEEAVSHVEEALGVRMQSGGHHARFGTYNRLLGLADGLYLEAIAIDPEAPDPGRPRWFDLDRLSGPAHLRNWICRVEDLGATLADLPQGVGAPIDLERGDLRWQMAVPDDGRLPYDNIFPALIQWQGALHPANMLAPSGCSLKRLVVSHPDARELSGLIGAVERVELVTGPAGLKAEIDTPNGLRVLE
ncbi:polyphosphate kinase [Ruegeria marisrubri]|uniref:Polyphosphate kinase n=1 Tax=Ruegeria marisrubri TaxID=1685379 RepID=A0A0X3TMG6_9RHOB|nr:VOC family protein [Ruegeria marisrubri]KUJ76938.1 polyphosphate kinase [Ruegeria marisrubri]